MQPEWNFHYARWVIEDGQPNRRVGEIFTWPAIEFSAEKLVKVPEQLRSAVPVGDYFYWGSGRGDTSLGASVHRRFRHKGNIGFDESDSGM